MVFHYNQVGIKTDPFTEDTDGDYISDLDEVKPNSVLNKIYDNLDPVKENWVGYFVMGYNLYDEIKFDSSSDDGLNTYCDHVRKYNEVKTRIIVKDWSAPNYLKYRLQTEFDNGLIGAVFVGHAPTAFWEDTDDNDYGGSHPCDWYYQDLDGSWEDVWAPHSSQLLVETSGTTSSSSSVFGNNWFAQSFTTPDDSTKDKLEKIQLKLSHYTTGCGKKELEIKLYSDNSGSIGNLIDKTHMFWYGITTSENWCDSLDNFNVVLQPNTRYWIVLASPDSDSNNYYKWYNYDSDVYVDGGSASSSGGESGPWTYSDSDHTFKIFTNSEEGTDGVYETHTDGYGDKHFEIWIGQLRPPVKTKDNVNWLTETKTYLLNYFNKGIKYMNGELPHRDNALYFADDDNAWTEDRTGVYNDFQKKFSYDKLTTIGTSNNKQHFKTTGQTYLDYIENLNLKYEFIYLTVHSNPTGHYFENVFLAEQGGISGFDSSITTYEKIYNGIKLTSGDYAGTDNFKFTIDKTVIKNDNPYSNDPVYFGNFQNLHAIVKPGNGAEKVRFGLRDYNDRREEFLLGDADNDGWFEVGWGKDISPGTQTEITASFSSTKDSNGNSAGGITVGYYLTVYIDDESIWEFNYEIFNEKDKTIWLEERNNEDEVTSTKISNPKTYFYLISGCNAGRYSYKHSDQYTIKDYLLGRYIFCGNYGLGGIGMSTAAIMPIDSNQIFFNYINSGYMMGTNWFNRNLDPFYDYYYIIYFGDPTLRT